jgi:hypothetical protein
MQIKKAKTPVKQDLFTAMVITSNAGSGAVTVVREFFGSSPGGDMGLMVQGTVISSVMSSFLGFKESTLPQPGNRVLCLSESATNCFILGVIPDQTLGEISLPSRAMLGAGNALGDKANRVGHEKNTIQIFDVRRPTDVVDGEHVISNEFGVLLGLYQQLANLKASELAQVQCFLLDDLVRIISHNFQHYTALGEYNIYHDGKRLMAEFGATHKPAESYGSPAVENDEGNEKVFEETGEHSADDEKDLYKISTDERIKAIERFKLFLGSVGDFLHLFVVKPDSEEIRILDPDKTPEKPDTGLCDLHIGTDGGMHIRSVKEVFIEKTNWIRVPLRKAAPDDPNGDDAENLDYDKKEKFEFEDSYRYKENPFNYSLQIRDYVAYVNEKLGYQNFKKHEKDFYVNDDISKEKSLKEIEKIDKETDLNLKDYSLRTAGIYLMPNGGITIRDAWNSAIVMEGGNVYIQPAKDLVAQPLRNTIVKGGGNISVACKKHIDLSSSEEGVRIKSEKSQYLYSNKGGFVIESNGEEDSAGTPDPAEKAIENIGGIVLKSKLSIYSYADKNVVSYAKEHLLLQSLDNLDIISDNVLTTYGKQSIYTFADDNIISYSGNTNAVISDGSAIFAGADSTALGQEDQNLGVMYDKNSKFIDILKGAIPVSDFTSQLQKAKDSKDNVLKQTVFQEEAKFDSLKFKFLSSDQYGNLDPREDGLPATLAQQDDLLTRLYTLKEWTEKEVNESLPYPGKDLFENFYYSSEKPVNLEENKLGKDYSNKAESESKPATISLDSLNKYKVQS